MKARDTDGLVEKSASAAVLGKAFFHSTHRQGDDHTIFDIGCRHDWLSGSHRQAQ